MDVVEKAEKSLLAAEAKRDAALQAWQDARFAFEAATKAVQEAEERLHQAREGIAPKRGRKPKLP